MSHSSGLNSQVDVQVIVTESEELTVDKEYQKPAYVAVALAMAVTGSTVFFPMIVTSSLFGLNESLFSKPPSPPCKDPCR